jgi:Calcineurin-like phosphoesterase
LTFIGDVHGCFDELVELLTQLGYSVEKQSNSPGSRAYSVKPPEGRKVVFLGDLVDRGPKIPEVLRLAMSMVEAGTAHCVPGNHDIKLMRTLRGKDVQITHGLADSLQQLDNESQEFRAQVSDFLDELVSHYALDEGRLVVAHAGMKEEMQGRGSGKVRDLRSTARRRARPMNAARLFATTGLRSIVAGQWWSMATLLCPGPIDGTPARGVP